MSEIIITPPLNCHPEQMTAYFAHNTLPLPPFYGRIINYFVFFKSVSLEVYDFYCYTANLWYQNTIASVSSWCLLGLTRNLGPSHRNHEWHKICIFSKNKTEMIMKTSYQSKRKIFS